MQRIVIVGNSGSGKSTMASALARTEALQHLDLDTLAWDGERPTQRRALAASSAELHAFIGARQRWVIEGCYSDLAELAVMCCTRLVFLNPGIEACIQNCRSRPWEPHKYPTLAAQNQNLAMLIAWIQQYEQRDDEFGLQRHRRLFAEFQGDKIEITSSGAALPVTRTGTPRGDATPGVADACE
jgi:adenylate kinase family enzyme